MPSKLQLYNKAARHLGETRLASTSENRELRYQLDAVYDDGFVKRCLEQGLWNFATRTTHATYDSGVSPSFGYRYAYAKPSDWVRTAAVSASEYFSDPLLAYADEAGYWWADLQDVYIKYVSDDADYGSDLSLWPESFSEFAGVQLAADVAMGHTGSDDRRDRILRDLKLALRAAQGTDAMNQPTAFPPAGSWVRARRGSGGNRTDRGNTGSLIG